MPSEAELLDGEFAPSEDHEGMSELINNLWNHLARRRVKMIRLIEANKQDEAIALEETTDKMSKQLDSLIASFMRYDKFQKLINPVQKEKKGKGDDPIIPPHLRTEESLNGGIVKVMPKSK